MHKPVILLTSAFCKEQALEYVHIFMSDYINKVFDWYAIGGRWHNTLTPKYDEWEEFIDKRILMSQKGKGSPYPNDKNIIEDKLQQSWRDMGMKGKHPRFNHYDLPYDGNYYDIMPLKDCLETVSSWIVSKEEMNKTHQENLVRWKDNPDMIKYFKKSYKKLLKGEFTDERNVFNIDLYEPETIPEDISNYLAVMVDMHV